MCWPTEASTVFAIAGIGITVAAVIKKQPIP
jgi:hypothetical protein